MRKLKRVLMTCLFVVVHAIGLALAMKGKVGILPYDSFVQTASDFSNIKVGTMIIIINTFFVLMQIIILKKDFKIIQFLQLVISSILGVVVNLFYYDIFSFEVNKYIFGLILFLISIPIQTFAIGGMMAVGLTTYPGEGFSLAVSKKSRFSFSVVRQALDVFMTLGALLITFFTNADLYVREGTIIGAVVFSPLLGFFKDKLTPFFKSKGLGE